MKIACCKYIWGTYGYDWEEGKEVGRMWAGVQISASFVKAYCVFIRASSSASSPRDNFNVKQKETAEKLKTPPYMTISNGEPSQVSVSLVIKGCMRRGTRMGLCYFLCIRHALARCISSLLCPVVVQLCHRTPLDWDFYFQTQTPRTGDANFVFAVNFTSLGFVGLAYNMGVREINPALHFIGAMHKKEKIGLWVNNLWDHKNRLCPTLTHCVCLCFLSSLLNFASSSTALPFDNSSSSLSALPRSLA